MFVDDNTLLHSNKNFGMTSKEQMEQIQNDMSTWGNYYGPSETYLSF